MPSLLSKSKLSFLRKFLQKKTRVAERCFLIEGWHLLDEALKSGLRLDVLVFDEAARREEWEDALLDRALAACEAGYVGPVAQMSQISDTKSPKGDVLCLLALDGVADPGNCGAIIRSCAWYGIDGVLLGAGCAELENGKTVRSTMGGLFHLPVAVGVDLPVAFCRLSELGVSVLTTELSGPRSLQGFEFPERAVLAIGNEARGVSKEVSALAAERLRAPRFGKGESLNAACAAAVFLSHWRMG